MNMISASGLPTPKTVCVRELARCGHFVQTLTRSRIGASKSCLLEETTEDGWRSDGVDGGVSKSRSSAARVAHGVRSVPSRIRSKRGDNEIESGFLHQIDHVKFCARPQFLLMMQ